MNRFLLGLSIFCLTFLLKGQSIYSFQGLGSIHYQGFTHNMAMGEVAIGSPSYTNINIVNPSALVFNGFSSFQVGLEYDRRSFSGDGVSGSDADGRLSFLSYSFPVIQSKWNSAFGIGSLSTVNYNTFSTGPVIGADEDVVQIIDNNGEGGLTNFYWANGFKITNSIYFGFKGNFSFGNITRNGTFGLDGVDILISNNTQFKNESVYSDVNILFGLTYFKNISDKNFLILGTTYSPSSSYAVDQTVSLIRIAISGDEIQEEVIDEFSSAFEYPTTFGVGLSFGSFNKYAIGIDYETQSWSSSENGFFFNAFQDAYKIAVGARFTPDFDDVNNYIKRIKYAFGFNYQRLPYVVQNQALTDIGINFGASLPVGLSSSLDLAFKVGQLGETTNNLIRESYFKIIIGATINDRWFIQRRYD